jgi:hypothetical protein
MARKKSVKKSASDFRRRADAIVEFVDEAEPLGDKHLSWAYEYGIIRLYREFEAMMLAALVGAINNDTQTVSARTAIAFPKHLTDEVCEFLITGNGYFNVRGRAGLIDTLGDYVPETHYLVAAVKNNRYKDTLEQLCALRNLAAHNSSASKTRAKKAVGQVRMSEAGSWLKKQRRLLNIVDGLKQLADEIEVGAPY